MNLDVVLELLRNRLSFARQERDFCFSHNLMALYNQFGAAADAYAYAIEVLEAAMDDSK